MDIKQFSINFSLILKEERLKKKISQEKLAYESGVSYSSIRRFENLNIVSNPKINNLLNLCQILDIKVNILIEKIINYKSSNL